MEAAFATERTRHGETSAELQTTRDQLKEKEEMLQQLGAKFARNRTVWMENERRAKEEILKLDTVIDNVIATLTAAGEVVQRVPSLKRLLDELDGRVPIKPELIKSNGTCETKLN